MTPVSHKPVRSLAVLDDGDTRTLLKVAFATSDRKNVDQHFGSAQSFVIFGIDLDQARLLSVTEFGEQPATESTAGEQATDGSEDKLADKLELLKDCIAVYCRACGASAVRQLISAGIQPVKVTEGMAIADLIAGLQQELRDGPSTWLAKAMGRGTMAGRSRFDAIEAEGWTD
jgi:nitrogen fixation protein NifX